MANALFLISLGILFLLNNFNILPWSMWMQLFPYWPVIFIFAGIDMIFGNSSWGKLISGILNTAIFLAIVARVVGLNLPLIDIIPLPPEERYSPEDLFTEKHDVRFRFDDSNFSEDFF